MLGHRLTDKTTTDGIEEEYTNGWSQILYVCYIHPVHFKFGKSWKEFSF